MHTSFPKEKPTGFPCRAGKGNAIVTLYLVVHQGYDEFKIPYLVEGKRRFHSFPNYESARKRGNEMIDQLAKGQGDAITLTSRDKVVYLEAIEAVRPHGVQINHAAANYAAHLVRIGNDDALKQAVDEYLKRHRKIVQKTVAEAVDEFIAEKRKRTKTGKAASEVYLKDAESRLGRFAEAFHVNLNSIEATTVREFLDSLNLAARTYHNYAQMLRTFFRFAQSHGWYPKDINPLEGVEFSFASEGTIEIFTPAEMASILSKARPEMVPFLAIGGFAGLRAAELGRLDWSHINLATGFIEVTAENAKTASRRLVPIQDNLKSWLTPFHKKFGPVLPFLNAPNQITALTAELKKDGPFKWKHNALRHSFISYRIAATNDVPKVALEAGNSPNIIFRNYRQLVTPKQAAQWFQIAPKHSKNVVPMTATA